MDLSVKVQQEQVTLMKKAIKLVQCNTGGECSSQKNHSAQAEEVRRWASSCRSFTWIWYSNPWVWRLMGRRKGLQQSDTEPAATNSSRLTSSVWHQRIRIKILLFQSCSSKNNKTWRRRRPPIIRNTAAKGKTQCWRGPQSQTWNNGTGTGNQPFQ